MLDLMDFLSPKGVPQKAKIWILSRVKCKLNIYAAYNMLLMTSSCLQCNIPGVKETHHEQIIIEQIDEFEEKALILYVSKSKLIVVKDRFICHE